jgi:hypothetical protein
MLSSCKVVSPVIDHGHISVVATSPRTDVVDYHDTGTLVGVLLVFLLGELYCDILV